MTDTELVARLERLERDNRRLKRVALGALVLVAASLGLGAAYAKPAVPQKIVAHEFDVVDGSGKVRVRLNVFRNGIASVGVLDNAGTVQAEMLDGPAMGGPSIAVGFHKPLGVLRGAPHGSLMPDINISDQFMLGPTITLTKPGTFLGPSVNLGVTAKDQPNVTLLGSKGHDRADIFLSSSGAPGITLSDPEGYSMDLGSTSLITPTTGETHQTSADSIVMFGNDKKHHVIWEAPPQ